ncbi:MAG: sigma factor-like helix-turn-helix DNA-binding protein, partial [Nocardioidaceae bacterium]
TSQRGEAAEPDFAATPCATNVDLFLSPMLEEPPVRSKVSRQTWREYETLVAQARGECSSCPLLDDCLYKAVAQADVAGYVGCTTPKERKAIRKHLGVEVSAEDLDAYTGVRDSRQPVDHDSVLRMRSQYPDESLDKLAERLGCSLSTVKRHMRRARREQSDDAAGLEADLPTMDEVFEAFEAVVEPNRARSRAC